MQKLGRVPIPDKQSAIGAQAYKHIQFFRTAQQRVAGICAVPTDCCDWLPTDKTHLTDLPRTGHATIVCDSS